MGTFFESQLNPVIVKSEDGNNVQLDVEGKAISALNTSEVGIAAVVPSYKLHEILHSKELEDRRRRPSDR